MQILQKRQLMTNHIKIQHLKRFELFNCFRPFLNCLEPDDMYLESKYFNHNISISFLKNNVWFIVYHNLNIVYYKSLWNSNWCENDFYDHGFIQTKFCVWSGEGTKFCFE